MKLSALLPAWRAPARIPEIRVNARTPGIPGAWTAAIAAGDAVIFPAGTEGFRLATDTAYPPGARLRISVTGTSAVGPDLEVTMEVRWRRRGEHPIFGRFTHGLTIHPPDQPRIPELSSRGRAGVLPGPVADDGPGDAGREGA